MQHVGPDQQTSTPLAIPSARALLSHNISRFVLTPNIATAITNVASAQERHDALLQKALVLESYLKDLGPLKGTLDYCTLATACQLALEGHGPPDLQDQEIATIAWQEAQLQRVSRLLEHLAKHGLIADIVEKEMEFSGQRRTASSL